MTPIFFNSSSHNYSPYPSDLHHEDHPSNHQFLSPNSQASSSSNSLTTHLFLNSNVHDQNGIFDRELHPQNQLEGDNFGSQPYTDQIMKDDHRIGDNNEKGIEFPTWNKRGINNMANDQNPMKWMSSKMRVMLKMKKSDPVNLRFSSSTREATKVEDDRLPISPMDKTDNSSKCTSSNNNIPIRVCSDCNTTKTPLWRSGPRGPKSLCNACGIRQRKARRALAAAAAAAENGNGNVLVPIITPVKVTKTQHKYHKKISNGHITKYKKRQYNKQITITTPSLSPSPSPSPSPLPSPSPSPSSSSSPRKNCVEEFLVSLSKNLTYYRVFPQDEKEAAILLMALSCGYVHET